MIILRILLTLLLYVTLIQSVSAQDQQLTDSHLIEKDKTEFSEGKKLYQAGKYTEALKHFDFAAKTGEDSGEATIMKGSCYYQMKKYDQALQEYNLTVKNAKLISVKNKAQKMARTLDCYMKGTCPGNCLKASMSGWRKMNVPGKPSRLVWMVFPYLDPAGKGGSEYWSNDHMGEVIEYVNGRPVNKGKCPICHGTTHVSL